MTRCRRGRRKEGVEWVEVQNKAKGAETAGKEKRFRPSETEERLVGYPTEGQVYNV